MIAVFLPGVDGDDAGLTEARPISTNVINNDSYAGKQTSSVDCGNS